MNIIQKQEFRDRMKAAAEKLQSVLIAHCGPLAGNAVWSGNVDNGKILDLVFSNDGISIIDSLKSDDSVEQHLIGFLRYIGASIDNETHDNTTTSMLLACSIIKHAYGAAGMVETPGRILSCLRDDILGYLKQNTITYTDVDYLGEKLCSEYGLLAPQLKDGLQHAVKDLIVTNVAMTSSKGDLALVEKIRELFLKSDFECMPERWKLNYGEQERHGGTLYDVKVPDYQFVSPYTRGASVPFLTEQEEYSFSADNAFCIITNEVIGAGMLGARIGIFVDNLHHTLLPENYEIEEEGVKSLKEPAFKTIDELYEGYFPDIEVPETIFIICPQAPRSLEPKLQEINAALRKNDRKQRYILIDVCSSEINSRTPVRKGSMRINSLVELCRKSNAKVFQEHGEECLAYVPGVTVTLKATEFELSNLYTKDENTYTPYYTAYKDTRGTLLENYTERLGELLLNPAMLDTVQTYIKEELEYNIQLLRSGPQPSIRVEGLTHSVRHKIHVIQDVYGSVYTALKAGVVLGGIPKIAQLSENTFSMSSRIVRAAIEDVMKATYQESTSGRVTPKCENSPFSYIRIVTDPLSYGVMYSHETEAKLLDEINNIYANRSNALEYAQRGGTVPMVAADGLLKSVERVMELIEPFLIVETFIDNMTPLRKG